MRNNKAVIQFLSQANKYRKLVNNDELFFYSNEAKYCRLQLVGLLRETEEDLNNLLGDYKQININSQHQVNVLTTALSEDYKGSIYCLDILLDTLNNYFNTKKNGSVSKTEVQELINSGESESLEFKSSLRWDIKKKMVNKDLEHVIAKTISAFMNSTGGKLLIGIEDSGKILGIQSDILTLKNQNMDGFLLQLTQIINDYLGKENHQFVYISILDISDKYICLIDVDASPNPVYVKNKEGKEEFYIRSAASSQPLSMSEANTYIRNHWLK